MLFILTYFHMYWRFTVLQTQTQIWWNYSQKAQLQKRKRSIRAKENKEGPSNLHIWTKHHQGCAPSPPRNRPGKGGGERAGPGCGCGRTTPKPSRPLSSLAVAWRLAMMVHGGFLFFYPWNRPHLAINRWVVLSFKHTPHKSLSPTHVSFYYS